MTKETALETIQSQALDFTLTREDVKRYFDKAGTCTESEVALFIKICQTCNLNPFKREAHLVKYGDMPASIVTGYEVYLKRAENSPHWGGYKVYTDGDGDDMKAIVEIYRKDWDKPFYHEVDYVEYVGKKKDGTPTRFWKEKPKTMLKKVAISQAFRLCFPDVLAGLPYTSDEINQDEPKLGKGKPEVDMPKAKSESKTTEPVASPVAVASNIGELIFEVDNGEGEISLEAQGKVMDINSKKVKKKSDGKEITITRYAIAKDDNSVVISKFGSPTTGLKVGDIVHFFDITSSEFKGETQYLAQEIEILDGEGEEKGEVITDED